MCTWGSFDHWSILKKMIFGKKRQFQAKKSFFSKLICDQNYIICTSKKIHFQNKIMRLQFSPDSTYVWGTMTFFSISTIVLLSDQRFVFPYAVTHPMSRFQLFHWRTCSDSDLQIQQLLHLLAQTCLHDCTFYQHCPCIQGVSCHNQCTPSSYDSCSLAPGI